MTPSLFVAGILMAILLAWALSMARRTQRQGAQLQEANRMLQVHVSERARAEAEIVSVREAAAAANLAKNEFLANMSHEIRTPMNGVIGMTDLVLDTELTAEQREFLRIVKSSADSLLTVIDDILDYSKIEAGKLELDPIDFDPRDTAGDTANTFAVRAQQKGLELIVDVPTTVPGLVNGDPGRLRQILVNLIGNAVKFTEQGEIVLRVTPEDETDQRIVLHFSVRDTGVGIPVERQRHIFEAFTQADASVTRVYGGTGLGLTISARLASMMGGRLWVESEVGKGSTFHVTADFGRVKSVAAPEPEPVDLSDLPVLVVDDNHTNRLLLEAILVGWRMRPTLADGVDDALTALRTAQKAGGPFSLVLSDVRMPGVDGFALAEQIKENPDIAGATIMMLTSAGQPGDAARCRQLGVAAYLAKPIRRSELREAMHTALGKRIDDNERRPLVTRHSLREARKTLRILLAEDNAVNQLLARRVLEKRGHVVVVANNGRQALTVLEDAAFEGFDCVLMDVQMPEMDGFECTRIIRERERTSGRHLPIFAMTAHAMKGDEARCLAVGMDGYLSKPIQTDELFELVEGRGPGVPTPPVAIDN